MRIAALYDIHGNLPALEVVLEEVRRASVDEVVVGGDVFPGPMCEEALERLLDLDLPVRFIHGNGDREVLARAAGQESDRVPEEYRATLAWVAKQLDPDRQRRIARWPLSVRVGIDGLGEVLFCHATPRNDTEIFVRSTPEENLRKIFESPKVSLVVCGHTHMQFDRWIGSVRVVNAGSVGMPFGTPGAHWLLLGPEVRLQQTSYDLTQAAERIRATSYPQAEEFAARNVLAPPSEQEMLERFRHVELK